jgi:hypothetical protein
MCTVDRSMKAFAFCKRMNLSRCPLNNNIHARAAALHPASLHIYVLLNYAVTSPCLVSFNSIKQGNRCTAGYSLAHVLVVTTHKGVKEGDLGNSIFTSSKDFIFKASVVKSYYFFSQGVRMRT